MEQFTTITEETESFKRKQQELVGWDRLGATCKTKELDKKEHPNGQETKQHPQNNPA